MINLSKGEKISLEKLVPGLAQVFAGLGWDIQTSGGAEFDIDAIAFLLNNAGKLISEKHLIFYNNKQSPDPERSVQQLGDNRTGAGEGDDEVIDVNLATLPTDVQKIVVVASIHEAAERQQNFGQVSNASIRLVNAADEKELVRYDLTEEFSIETIVKLGELYLEAGKWQFKALGEGFEGDLEGLIASY